MKDIKIAFIHPGWPIITGNPEKIKEYMDEFFEETIKEIEKWSEDNDCFLLEEDELRKTLAHIKSAVDEMCEGCYLRYEFDLTTFKTDREDLLMLHVVKEI